MSRKNPPPPMPMTVRRRGQPRRADLIAKVTTVRIDPNARAVLTREFGSLGNALYYMAQGIASFREAHSIPPHKEQVYDHDPEAGEISLPEMQILIEALDWRLDYAVDRREGAPFARLRDKILSWSRRRPKAKIDRLKNKRND